MLPPTQADSLRALRAGTAVRACIEEPFNHIIVDVAGMSNLYESLDAFMAESEVS